MITFIISLLIAGIIAYAKRESIKLCWDKIKKLIGEEIRKITRDEIDKKTENLKNEITNQKDLALFTHQLEMEKESNSHDLAIISSEQKSLQDAARDVAAGKMS